MKKVDEKKYWFKAKRYGWGWYPSSWQGWTIMVIWLALALDVFRKTDFNSNSASDTLLAFLVPFILLVTLLIFVCWGTGERPRWRWGK